MFGFVEIAHILLIVIPALYALQFLLGKNKNQLPYKILGIMMIFVSLYYIVNAKFLFPDNQLKNRLSQLFLFFLFLSINPFFYLYTESLSKENYQWSTKKLIHYFPAIILLVWTFLAYINSNTFSDEVPVIFKRQTLKIVSIIIYNLQILGYSIGMFILLKNHSHIIHQNFSYINEKNNLNWLKILLIMYVSFSIIDLSVYYFKLYNHWAIYYYILTNIFFIFVGFKGLNQQDVYLKSKIIDKELIEDPINQEGTIIDDDNKSKKEIISKDKSNQIFNEIVRLLNDKKVYKNSELTIYDIADFLKINKTYISYVINNKTGENFNSFINKFRIEEAKLLLSDQNNDTYTIEALANEVGFHSKSSFNIAFKKITGLTPSEYKKQIRL